jgi:alpha/beta superfamily hydrolase
MAEVLISGPEGRLEGRYYQGKQDGSVALILHPHPNHGGNMHSKVVYNLFRSFAKLGFSVLRFNFRGVGRSEGTFSGDDGELNDASACLNWLYSQNYHPQTCWVAGFSFGAWVAMHLLMRRPEINNFIAVSPPANLYDFSFLAPCPAPGLILQGGQDKVVPKDVIVRFHNRLMSQKSVNIDLEIIRSADHFFNNQLETLSQKATAYIEKELTPYTTEKSAGKKPIPKKDKN